MPSWQQDRIGGPFRFARHSETGGLPDVWGAERCPARRLILHVLRHEAPTVPRAREGSASIETAFKLIPNPFNDFPRLLDVMRPATEHDKPLFTVLVDRTVDYNIYRLAVIQGHSIPVVHPGALGGRLHLLSEEIGSWCEGVQPRRRHSGRSVSRRAQSPGRGKMPASRHTVRIAKAMAGQTRARSAPQDSERIIVYDGRHLVHFSRECETLSGDFVTQKPVQREVFGQVAARISDGKDIARGSRTVTMGEESQCAIVAYTEQVRTSPICAAQPQKLRRAFQHRKRLSEGLPWWVRAEETLAVKLTQ